MAKLVKKVFCVGCGRTILPANYEPGDPKVCEKCWQCPDCGMSHHTKDGEEGCIVDADDEVLCRACGGGVWSFSEFEKATKKRGSMEKCPICKGSGMVPKPKKEKR